MYKPLQLHLQIHLHLRLDCEVNNPFLSLSSEKSDASSINLLFDSDHNDNDFFQTRQQQQVHRAAIDILLDDNDEGSNVESLIPIEAS